MRLSFRVLAPLFIALVAAGDTDADTLDIHFIDVEGGAATLIVTPERQSVLIDAGYRRDDHRDVERIERALRDAGVTRIDYFVASHFHGDHVGGLAELAKRVPIGTFIDHGDSVEQAREGGASSGRRTARRSGPSAAPSHPETSSSSPVSTRPSSLPPGASSHRSPAETTRTRTAAPPSFATRMKARTARASEFCSSSARSSSSRWAT